ncbi:hypothetical protein JCM11641_000764 [Rhodosporidiobolus odoratus]
MVPLRNTAKPHMDKKLWKANGKPTSGRTQSLDHFAAVDKAMTEIMRRTGIENNDGVQSPSSSMSAWSLIAVIGLTYLCASSSHFHVRGDEPNHLRVLFFELLDGEFWFQLWKDRTGKLGGETAYHPDEFPAYESGSRMETRDPNSGCAWHDRIPGTNWFIQDDVQIFPYKTIEDQWESIGQGREGQTFAEIARKARDYFRYWHNLQAKMNPFPFSGHQEDEEKKPKP